MFEEESLDLYRLTYILAHKKVQFNQVQEQLKLLRLLFNLYDHDGGGSLSVEEIRTLLSASGSQPQPKLIEELLRFADSTVFNI